MYNVCLSYPYIIIESTNSGAIIYNLETAKHNISTDYILATTG